MFASLLALSCTTALAAPDALNGQRPEHDPAWWRLREELEAEFAPALWAWSMRSGELAVWTGSEPPIAAMRARRRVLGRELALRMERISAVESPKTADPAAALLAREIADLDARIAAHVSGPLANPWLETASSLDEWLADLGHRYDLLLRDAPSLRDPLPQDVWCSVLVHTALVRLAEDREDAIAPLEIAAVAAGRGCQSQILPFLDVPLFQVAWSQVLRLSEEKGTARLQLRDAPGHWTVDGFPIASLGHETLEVGAGWHRIELIAPGGHLDRKMVYLEPGDSIEVFRAPAGIDLHELRS